MTINATLKRLVISSPQVERVAQFYVNTFGYRTERRGDEAHCEGQYRSLWIRPGRANQLLESHFVFPDEDSLQRYVARLEDLRVAFNRGDCASGATISVEDPQGHRVSFATEAAAERALAPRGKAPPPHSARLQHFAVRTPAPQVLVSFYAQSLGFSISDLVRDESGDLTAAFLRSDRYHHSLAIFRASEARFDHFSCETHDWHTLRDWADSVARCGTRLAWGIGRHGPGNDTFFMVLDPDGNLAEISSDLETCEPDRPVGSWNHCMETLNQWGVAIMRS
jgi:catechol-2,3-dioxygenase